MVVLTNVSGATYVHKKADDKRRSFDVLLSRNLISRVGLKCLNCHGFDQNSGNGVNRGKSR